MSVKVVFISIITQMDEDKGKGSSTFTKAVSERLEEEVCKAHKINCAG